MTGILRITSRCIARLAIIAAITMIWMLQTDNEYIKAYLSEIEGRQLTCNTAAVDKPSALLACAIEFANRINPPIVKEEQQSEQITCTLPPHTPDSGNDSNASGRQISEPPAFTPKYELVGTVTYKAFPEKSLALIRTKADRCEWFIAGQKIGHHQILGITDGTMLIKNGHEQQELSVPSKPSSGLLKDG